MNTLRIARIKLLLTNKVPGAAGLNAPWKYVVESADTINDSQQYIMETRV